MRVSAARRKRARERSAPKDRRVRITFHAITPESAENSDWSDSGWIDEEGVSMEPDAYDIEDGVTAVDKAIKSICGEGATEASSSDFHAGIWYSETDGNQNYRTGETTFREFHPSGFTVEEQREIYEGIVNRRCGRR